MQLLFKAVSCKEFQGKKYLFPGYPPGSGMMDVRAGDRIKVEKQDGTLAETTVQGILPCIFDEVFMKKLSLRVAAGFYFAIEVSRDFNDTGNVYLEL